jgi:hypothetical protein
MNSLAFYEPISAFFSQLEPSRSSCARTPAAASASTAPMGSIGVADFSQRGDWEGHNRIKVANMSEPAPKGRPLGIERRMTILSCAPQEVEGQ